MTLLERIASLKERCTNLENINSRIDEAAALSRRLSELKEAVANLPACLVTIQILQQAGIPFDEMPNALRAQSALAKVRSRFAQNRAAAALTRGQDWNQLLRELPATVRANEALAANAWKGYVERIFAGEAPAAIENSLAQTDRNQETLKRYKQAYEIFSRTGAILPKNLDDVEAIRKAAENLALIAKDFDFDVPGAVKEFLDALSQGGAPISLLTEEVRAWIAGQGQTNRYRVVAGGR